MYFIKANNQRVRVLKKAGTEWKVKFIGKPNIGWFHVSEITISK